LGGNGLGEQRPQNHLEVPRTKKSVGEKTDPNEGKKRLFKQKRGAGGILLKGGGKLSEKKSRKEETVNADPSSSGHEGLEGAREELPS